MTKLKANKKLPQFSLELISLPQFVFSTSVISQDSMDKFRSSKATSKVWLIYFLVNL